MADLSIGEVAKRSGLASSALRFYEREGLLPKAHRVSGRRWWDASVLDQLAVIALAREAGFTLAEIKVLLRSRSGTKRWRTMAARKLSEVEATIRRAESMRRILQGGLSCDCIDLRTCAELARRAQAQSANY